MQRNEPNIYIGEKKSRSFGGYGQRSRTARAETGCGPTRDGPTVLRLPAHPHPLSGLPSEHYRKPRARIHDRDSTLRENATRKGRPYSFFNLLYLLIFIIFSHFDILFFSWCASQLTCCAWPDSIRRSCDRQICVLFDTYI